MSLKRLNFSKIVATCFIYSALFIAFTFLGDANADEPVRTNSVRRGFNGRLSTKEKQLSALKQVIETLEYDYPDTLNKQRLYGHDLKELEKKYAKLIETATTVDEAYGLKEREERDVLSTAEARYVLIALISEYHDGHMNAWGPDLTYSAVGFRTFALNGRLYVSDINKSLIKTESEETPVQQYDEIIKLNGRDIQYYKIRNLNYINNGTIEARKDEALERILEIPHALLPPIGKNNERVSLTFRRGKKVFTNTYRWVEMDPIEVTRPLSPSRRTNFSLRQIEDAPLVFGEKGNVRSYFYEGLLSLQKLLKQNNTSEFELEDVGGPINVARAKELAKLTSLATTKALQAEDRSQIRRQDYEKNKHKIARFAPVDRLQAYIIRGFNKPIGVIRIPSYSPPGGIPEVFNEINWISQVILTFKQIENLDTIIIDQLSNPGGSTVYGHLLLSMLAKPNEPLTAMKLRLLLTETLYSIYLQDESAVYPFEDTPEQHQKRKQFFEELEKQRKSGQKLSRPIPFNLDYDYSLENRTGLIPPAEYNWDKNIVVLTDSRSASMGEIIPAILQDNKRALVFGEKTMGLGNPVVGHSLGLSLSELNFSCPFAICTRSNGTSIENVGVTPDVVRLVSERDLKTNFALWAQDIITTANLFSMGNDSSTIQAAINNIELKRNVKNITRAENATIEEVHYHRKELNKKLARLNPQGITAENVEEWLEAYSTFFKELSRIEDTRILPASIFNYIVVDLPKFLIAKDRVLAQSTRKDVVLRRFEEMLNLHWVKQKPELTRFLKELRTHAMSVEGFYHFGLPCTALFLATNTAS